MSAEVANRTHVSPSESSPEAPIRTVTATAADIDAGASPQDDSRGHRLSFAWMPREIQDAIWTECLPSRVVELCPQAGLATSNQEHYADPELSVNMERGPPLAPSRPPRIAEVAYHPRILALAAGRWTTGAGGTRVWFDASRDTILLNGELVVDYELGDGSGSGSGTVNCTGTRSTPPPPLLSLLHEAAGGVAVPGEVLVSYRGHHVFPLLDRHRTDPAAPVFRGPLMVFFDSVTLKGTRQQAVDSGLFDLFLETPRFFVRLGDTDTIRHLRELGRRPGALRIGNAGFLRELAQQSQVAQNQRLLEEAYSNYRRFVHPGIAHMSPAAVAAEMPHFEHVVLFRFQEEEATQTSALTLIPGRPSHWYVRRRMGHVLHTR